MQNDQDRDSVARQHHGEMNENILFSKITSKK